jgi:hypothetical protein
MRALPVRRRGSAPERERAPIALDVEVDANSPHVPPTTKLVSRTVTLWMLSTAITCAVICPVWPPKAAEITDVPVARAFVLPVEETVATAAFELCHVAVLVTFSADPSDRRRRSNWRLSRRPRH